jgi:hypothetical protein
MGRMVAAPVVHRVNLKRSWVLSQAWELYKRLFMRSFLMGIVVLGVVNLLRGLAQSGRAGLGLSLVALLASIFGFALLQGGLVEIVRGLHVDGDDDASITEVLARAGAKLTKLVCVSLLAGIGITLGFLFFIVPGIVLMTWWAVAVPVAMNEEGNARDALRRSREIVRGHGWIVWRVKAIAGFLGGLAAFPIVIVAAGQGPIVRWIAVTIAFAVSMPYLAHALTVVYYALVDPIHPVVQPPGARNAPAAFFAAEAPTAPEPLTIDEEYLRKFEEREKRWGG